MPAVRRELPWRRGAVDARPPRLVTRFVIWAMLALGLGAAAMIYLARRDAIAQAERNAVVHATLVADTVLQTSVQPSDFRPGLAPSRLDELDGLFERDVLSDDTVRVKLYAPTGTVTYSTNRRQIGTAPEPEETAEVMGGETVTGITDLAAEGGGGPGGRRSRCTRPYAVRTTRDRSASSSSTRTTGRSQPRRAPPGCAQRSSC